jgi:AcrR family transcriptional regulator
MSTTSCHQSQIFSADCLPAFTQKQEQILQGAMRVFLREGYSGTSMDRVSSEAGVSKQTIYSHFVDKEGLFKALVEWVTIANFSGIRYAEEVYGEPGVFLRNFAKTYFTKIADNQNYLGLFRLIITESQRFPELATLYTQVVIQRGRQLLVDFFNHHPELEITDPEATAHIFMGSLVSYIMVQEMLYGKEILPLSRDRVLDSLIKLIIPLS